MLGVVWKVQSDQLVFDLSEIVRAAGEFSHPTKRQITSIVGKVYNPLDILTPVITPFKIFLQDLRLAKVDWQIHYRTKSDEGTQLWRHPSHFP